VRKKIDIFIATKKYGRDYRSPSVMYIFKL